MGNAWTWWLVVGTAVATVFAFLLAVAFRRQPRAVGLGALLIPVTAMYLWSFGLTANNGDVTSTTVRGFAVPVIVSPAMSAAAALAMRFRTVPSVPATASLKPGSSGVERLLLLGKGPVGFERSLDLIETVSRSASAAEAFWLGMCVLAVALLIATFASRPAGYLAAAGLVAFGVYQLVAVAVFDPRAKGVGAWDWLYGETSRGTGGPTIVIIEVPCALSSPKISTC